MSHSQGNTSVNVVLLKENDVLWFYRSRKKITADGKGKRKEKMKKNILLGRFFLYITKEKKELR